MPEMVVYTNADANRRYFDADWLYYATDICLATIAAWVSLSVFSRQLAGIYHWFTSEFSPEECLLFFIYRHHCATLFFRAPRCSLSNTPTPITTTLAASRHCSWGGGGLPMSPETTVVIATNAYVATPMNLRAPRR